MLQVNGTVTLNGNDNETAHAALIEMMRITRAEDGCLAYTFARDLSDANTLVVYEKWRDRAALDRHIKSEHMAQFQKVMAANPPAAQELRIYETDDGKPLG